MRLLLEEPPTSALLIISYLFWRTPCASKRTWWITSFNSSEMRLARVLLLMAHFGKEGKPEPVIAKISQETLAEMIGTTRSRVSFFMNKFRKWVSSITTARYGCTAPSSMSSCTTKFPIPFPLLSANIEPSNVQQSRPFQFFAAEQL